MWYVHAGLLLANIGLMMFLLLKFVRDPHAIRAFAIERETEAIKEALNISGKGKIYVANILWSCRHAAESLAKLDVHPSSLTPPEKVDASAHESKETVKEGDKESEEKSEEPRRMKPAKEVK